MVSNVKQSAACQNVGQTYSRSPVHQPGPKWVQSRLASWVNPVVGFDCCKPTSAWRQFLPVRASASVSPAISVKRSALSSSRYANNPASEVTADPRNQATVKIEPNNIRFCFTSRVFQEFPQSDDIKQPISESARELLTHCVIRRMRAYGKLPIGEKLEKPPTAGSKLPLSL
jgi:hypothetical protein